MEPEMTTTTRAAYPLTSPLAREDILGQAKQGGFVICRLPITEVDREGSSCDPCFVSLRANDSGDTVWIDSNNILAIEPPYAEQVAVLWAGIEERDRIIGQLQNRMAVPAEHLERPSDSGTVKRGK